MTREIGGRLAAGIVVAALCALAPAARAVAALPDDLHLDQPAKALTRTEPVPNPHGQVGCERCHTKRADSYEVARRFGIRMPLITEGENSILLCEQCHKEAHPFHPVNFAVKRLREAIEKAGIFPLEVPVEGINKVTCTTCHAVHFPHTVNRLLRGFPVDELVGGAPFRTRLDFCRGCHGAEEVAALSGHATTAGEQGCRACHGPRDIAGRIGALKSVLNTICSVCHPPEPGRPLHFTAYNPFPDIRREDLAGYGVILQQERFTCATCHTHHRAEPDSTFLKAGFVAAVAKSMRVNPHETTRFCLNCHPVTPPPPGTPGAVAPLIEEDVTRLCRGCHGKEGALQMHHPLVVPPAARPVPADWPLRKDGTLGCQTCHLAGHGLPDPANPKFLRGGPYHSRNDSCFRCHPESGFRGRNIHSEVAAGAGCDFCHEVSERSATNPAGKAGAILAEPNLLCLPCHGPLPHPASADHTVKPAAHSFLTIDPKRAPLTYGKVTCHSCHDSHGTSTEGRLLRTIGRAPICGNCHPF